MTQFLTNNPTPDDGARLRAEARDPATPTERLQALSGAAKTLKRRTVDALAANPGVPLASLAKLIERAPGAFCRNPIAPLIPIEDPTFARKISRGGVARMLRSPRAPFALVFQVATETDVPNRRDLVKAAQMHISQQPAESIDDWPARIRAYWLDCLQQATCDSDRRHRLFEAVELGLLPGTLVEQAGLEDPQAQETYAELLTQVSSNAAAEMERGAADPPEEELPGYADRDELYAFIGAAFRGNVPAERLTKWQGRDEWLDLGIAQSPNTSPELLVKLANSYYPSVRRMVRRHPTLPLEAQAASRLRVLRPILHVPHYHDWYIPSPLDLLLRFAALRVAPSTTGRPLWNAFARSPIWEERLAAAVAITNRPSGQPPRPRHIALLRLLANDGNVLVRAAAQARLRGEEFTWEGTGARVS